MESNAKLSSAQPSVGLQMALACNGADASNDTPSTSVRKPSDVAPAQQLNGAPGGLKPEGKTNTVRVPSRTPKPESQPHFSPSVSRRDSASELQRMDPAARPTGDPASLQTPPPAHKDNVHGSGDERKSTSRRRGGLTPFVHQFINPMTGRVLAERLSHGRSTTSSPSKPAAVSSPQIQAQAFLSSSARQDAQTSRSLMVDLRDVELQQEANTPEAQGDPSQVHLPLFVTQRPVPAGEQDLSLTEPARTVQHEVQPAVIAAMQHEVQVVVHQPPVQVATQQGAAPVVELPVQAQPAAPKEGRMLARDLRAPEVQELLLQCRRHADISVAQGLRTDGYLDQLYRLYKSHTPSEILLHDPMRTVVTLGLLVDLDISPQQLREALAHNAVRDFFAQGAVSEGGYLGSWAAATALVITMLENENSEFSRALLPAIVAGVGLCMVLRLQRKGDLFPSWSVPRVFDLDGRPVVPASTPSGFAKSCLAYWGFSIPLLVITLDTHTSTSKDDRAAYAQALSLKKAWRRLTWNLLSSGLVAVTRYFMFQRERVYLNARPVYAGETEALAKFAMKGALEELTCGARWYQNAALKTMVAAPLRYGLAGAEGLARWAGMDCIPDALESEQFNANRHHLGPQDDYEATMTDYGLDILSGFVLSATALFVNGLALWISHQPARKAREWDVAHAILILQMSWGIAVALRDLMSRWNESTLRDTKAVTQRRRLRLATAGGLGRPGASLVAPRVLQARAAHVRAAQRASHHNPGPGAVD